MQEEIVYFLDLFGTVIFAITGAVKGVRLRLDLFGVMVYAVTVGSSDRLRLPPSRTAATSLSAH